MLRPAGVSACFPAPQPKGRTSLLLPLLSSTTSASRGNLPPPSGCRRPRRTKWLFEGVAACMRGSEKGADEGSLCVKGSWHRTEGCRVGDMAYRSGRAELLVVGNGSEELGMILPKQVVMDLNISLHTQNYYRLLFLIPCPVVMRF
jgi:hypothetical protein